MVYERVRGWTSGRSLPVQNIVKYPPPLPGLVTRYFVTLFSNTHVDVNFCDLAKLPNPPSGCLTTKEMNELRQWTHQYGRRVSQNTTRNFSMKDKLGTLPLNLYESAPPEQHSEVLLNEDIPAQQDTSTTHNVVITQSTYVVVSRMYKPRSAPNSPLYITPGGGDTPLYGLYRYVRPQRVWFFSCSSHR